MRQGFNVASLGGVLGNVLAVGGLSEGELAHLVVGGIVLGSVVVVAGLSEGGVAVDELVNLAVGDIVHLVAGGDVNDSVEAWRKKQDPSPGEEGGGLL